MVNLNLKFRKVDNKIGLFFNRPRGILSPLIADAQLKKSQIGNQYKQNEEVVEKVDNGAYVIENAYDEEVIDKIREEIEDHLENSENVHITDVDGKDFLRTLFGDELDFGSIEGFENLLSNSEVDKAIKSYFGGEYNVERVQAMRYEHVPPETIDNSSDPGNPGRWHFDRYEANNSFKLLVFLNDSGPTQAVSSRNSRELLRNHDLQELKNNPELVPEDQIQDFGGEKGTALLFNPCIQFHRGSNPEPGEVRTVVTFSLVPK